ncbi:MAG: UPF0175 family protein [Promethearchaeota archaeon]
MTVLSVRLDKDIESKLNLLLKIRKIQDKSTYIRGLLSKSLQNELIEYYCNQVKIGKISLWKAAELSGLSLREMMIEIGNRKITLFDDKALKYDIEFADKYNK